jgi:hypothetical protein
MEFLDSAEEINSVMLNDLTGGQPLVEIQSSVSVSLNANPLSVDATSPQTTAAATAQFPSQGVGLVVSFTTAGDVAVGGGVTVGAFSASVLTTPTAPEPNFSANLSAFQAQASVTVTASFGAGFDNLASQVENAVSQWASSSAAPFGIPAPFGPSR